MPKRPACSNVEIRVADGESLPVESGSFDAAVCRLGLMFFPDPLQGLREMHRALRAGRRHLHDGVLAARKTTPASAP